MKPIMITLLYLTFGGDIKLDTTVNANVAIAATTIVVVGDAATAGVGTDDVVILHHGFKNVRLQFAEVYSGPSGASAGVSTVIIKNALKSLHSAYKTDGCLLYTSPSPRDS